MNTKRPYKLPPELPDPPQPPAGHRGVYRGIKWRSDKKTSFSYTHRSFDGWRTSENDVAIGQIGSHYIEWVTLRPVPEGVAPVPEGFEFFSTGWPKYALNDLGDIAFLSLGGKWEIGRHMSGCSGTSLRIGSEIHHRHMDAPSPVTEPEFRYFRDKDGLGWKMPTNGQHGWFVGVGIDWIRTSTTLTQILAMQKTHGTIETDADGNPLVDTSAGNPVNIERPANRCNFYDPNPFGEIAPEQPAKAREWWICEATCPMSATPVKPKYSGAYVHVREVRADEAGLLEEAFGHLRNIMTGTGLTRHKDAAEWLSTNFPAPAPEPAFDWTKLWAMLPPWIDHIQHSSTGKWWGFDGKPTYEGGELVGSGMMPIPYDHAPPWTKNWETSLVQRPTPAQP